MPVLSLLRSSRSGQVQVKKGPVIALVLIVIVVIVSLVVPKIRSLYEARRKARREEALQGASAAAEFEHSIRVAGDPWSGYFIFRSEKLRQLLHHDRVRYQYVTEEDLSQRFDGLARDRWDIAVATVDGYTRNGLASRYPGVITWVIDESHGGDAFVGGPKVTSLDDLDTLTELPRVAFAAGYPSEHLLDAILLQFQKSVKRVPVGSSREAFDLLKAGQAEAAVLWEPETSSASKQIPGARVLLSTREMVDFIIDVVVMSRQLVVEKPDLAARFCRHYFSALRYYTSDRTRMAEAIARDAEVTDDVGRTILEGINFVNLVDNGFRWFGVGGPDAREKMSRIVAETVAIQKDHLPEGTLADPFEILNTSVLEAASKRTVPEALARKFKTRPPVAKPTPKAAVTFEEITDDDWSRARVVGTLDVAPIYFSSGSTEMSPRDRRLLDRVASKLSHYPRFRLRVVGHTSPGGDEASAKALSLARARAVVGYLRKAHGLSSSRAQAVGMGGTRPLPRSPGEPARAWRSRCQRVEFVLVNTDQE